MSFHIFFRTISLPVYIVIILHPLSAHPFFSLLTHSAIGYRMYVTRRIVSIGGGVYDHYQILLLVNLKLNENGDDDNAPNDG